MGEILHPESLGVKVVNGDGFPILYKIGAKM